MKQVNGIRSIAGVALMSTIHVNTKSWSIQANEQMASKIVRDLLQNQYHFLKKYPFPMANSLSNGIKSIESKYQQQRCNVNGNSSETIRYEQNSMQSSIRYIEQHWI